LTSQPLLIFFKIYYTQKMKILASRERAVCGVCGVVKNKMYKQKKEISVRKSCLSVLDPNTERAVPPLKGPPLFFKDSYILYCAKKIKSLFFASQDKKYFQSEQIFEVGKKTAKVKSVLSKD
jgi:hypothetical protein